jgi:hypothetical protein
MSGAIPDDATALALACYWSVIQIGESIHVFRPAANLAQGISREPGVGRNRPG